ncbi:MAG: adenylosuccinate lyase [Bacteroidota bacterium]|nr:adenylosuccinate lyase [Bacteroidota bacterium]
MNSAYLHAISPVDGRYRNKLKELSDYFSEASLFRYRLKVEVEYFIALCQIPLPQLASVPAGDYDRLRELYQNFNEDSAVRMKKIEEVTNHDIKAVEYFLKEEFEALSLSEYKEFIHFGLTSQDINNTAVPRLFYDAIDEILFPNMDKLVAKLIDLSTEWREVTMLARTHGQPASPTRLGKELGVFVERLEQQMKSFNAIPRTGKFGGATGNFNAHHVAYPNIDWPAFGDGFLSKSLDLKRSRTTTQIEHYDFLAASFDNLKRICTILIDLNRDLWTYISMDYFKQKIREGEVGSSAMPHKVNPIDFENSEGNLGFAIAIFEFLSSKLPVSRLQRDLTDSTVLRNIGLPVAHMLLGIKSSLKGLNKLILNEDGLKKDLEGNWNVVAEAIQTILRREGYPNPYEKLRDLTRKNEIISEGSIHDFVNDLDIPQEIKKEILKITPTNYTGIRDRF